MNLSKSQCLIFISILLLFSIFIVLIAKDSPRNTKTYAQIQQQNKKDKLNEEKEKIKREEEIKESIGVIYRSGKDAIKSIDEKLSSL